MKKNKHKCNIFFTLNKKEFKKIEVVKTGQWRGHVNGEFTIDEKDLLNIKNNFDGQKIDLVVDLDHATINKGTGEAYGWIKELEIKGDTLYAKVQWTKQGEKLIKEKKYKYISPVLLFNTIDPKSGKNIGVSLQSVALTNIPFMEDLGQVQLNKQQDKGKKMDKEELKRLQEENKTLKKEIKTLKEQLQKQQDEQATKEVDSAIAANKVTKEQRDSLIALGKANPKELSNLLANAKTIIQKPADDMYQNNNTNQQNEKFDVLQLGGIK